MDPEAILEATDLVRRFRREHPAVELWADGDHPDRAKSYFWVVTRSAAAVRNLAYLRVLDDRVERRGYDSAGEEIWIDLGDSANG